MSSCVHCVDGRLLCIQVTVQYEVMKESVKDAFYRLTDPKSQITAYVFDVVRAIVPKSDLDDVFTTKEEVSNDRPSLHLFFAFLASQARGSISPN